MTTTTATDAPAVPESPAPRRTARRGVLAVLMTLASLVLGVVVLQAGPANAATAVTGCFTSGGSPYANSRVDLVRYDFQRGDWVSIRSGKTNSSGCGTFRNVPAGDYTSMRAHRVIGDSNVGLAVFQSQVSTWATPGSGGVNIGRANVPLVHCTQGLYAYCAGL